MSVVAIDICFGLLSAMIGGIAGWVLRSRDASRCDSPGERENQTRFAQEVLARLQTVAADVAAGVGEHTSRVEEINEELSAGDDGQTETVVHAVENLLKANSQMQQQLDSADQRLKEQAQQIQSHATEARTDALTGLANRRAFDDEMSRRLAEYRRHGKGLSLVMVDIDHFKKVNDTHGHRVGDDVLRDLAKVLRQTARESDIVTRYGGEEFAVILPSTSVREAIEGAERFRRAIETHQFRSAKTELRVTASFGVAEIQNNDDAEMLIERADAALYDAKTSGRNSVFWNDGQEIRPMREETAQMPEAEAQHSEEDEPTPVEPIEETEATDKAAQVDEAPPTQWAEQLDTPTTPERYHDGSCDRTALQAFLESHLRRYGHGPDRPSVILVQIDKHSDVVVALGEKAGTLILRATPQFLKAAFRDMQMLARYNATTYAIVLSGADVGGAIGRAERMREAITRCKLPFGDKQLQFSVSVGMAESQPSGDVEQLLTDAEEALEAAVQSGGNASFLHNGQWSETAHSLLEQIP